MGAPPERPTPAGRRSSLARSPLHRFARLEAAGGIVLLACTAAALVRASSPWVAVYDHTSERPVTRALGPLPVRSSFRGFVHGGLTAVSFFLAGLAIERELLVVGQGDGLAGR